MLKREDIELHFSSSIDHSYKEELERLFFFNLNQKRFINKINCSIREYSRPVLVDNEENGEVSLLFKDQHLGQTLYIFDGDYSGANLIGVIMYVRDIEDMITLVHLVLHEECNKIYLSEKINIASIVLEKFCSILQNIKGVEKVRIYYLDKVFPVNQPMSIV